MKATTSSKENYRGKPALSHACSWCTTTQEPTPEVASVGSLGCVVVTPPRIGRDSPWAVGRQSITFGQILSVVLYSLHRCVPPPIRPRRRRYNAAAPRRRRHTTTTPVTFTAPRRSCDHLHLRTCPTLPPLPHYHDHSTTSYSPPVAGNKSDVFYEKKKNRKARKRATMSTEASLMLKYGQMAHYSGGSLSRDQVGGRCPPPTPPNHQHHQHDTRSTGGRDGAAVVGGLTPQRANERS